MGHHNDAIRAKACSAFSRLLVEAKTPSATLYRPLLRALPTLLTSADPTARNMATHAFLEAALCLRNRCATLNADVELSKLSAYSMPANGYPDASFSALGELKQTEMTHLDALG